MNDKIYDKLAKIIRHERSARSIGNLAEAEAFAGKVQELLTTYKLEMSEIDLEEHDREEIGEESPDIKVIHRPLRWQRILGSAIARANGCRVLSYVYHSKIIFVGHASDRKICVELFKYFVELAKQFAKKAADENWEQQRRIAHFYKGDGPAFYRTMSQYRESFCEGFSYTLHNRLIEVAQKAEAAKQQSEGENCAALVHLKRDMQAIDDYVAKRPGINWPRKSSPRRPPAIKNGDGFQAGMDAGQSVALTSKTLEERRSLKGA